MTGCWVAPPWSALAQAWLAVQSGVPSAGSKAWRKNLFTPAVRGGQEEAMIGVLEEHGRRAAREGDRLFPDRRAGGGVEADEMKVRLQGTHPEPAGGCRRAARDCAIRGRRYSRRRG